MKGCGYRTYHLRNVVSTRGHREKTTGRARRIHRQQPKPRASLLIRLLHTRGIIRNEHDIRTSRLRRSNLVRERAVSTNDKCNPTIVS